jgi:hypothetical protein
MYFKTSFFFQEHFVSMMHQMYMMQKLLSEAVTGRRLDNTMNNDWQNTTH